MKKIFLLMFILLVGIRLGFALPITNNLWNLDIEESNESMTYENGILYISTTNITSNKGIIYAVNSTNKNMLWNYTYGNSAIFKPYILENIITFTSLSTSFPYSTTLFSLNKSNGEQNWNRTFNNNEASLYHHPYLSGTNFYYKLNITNGSNICSFTKTSISSILDQDNVTYLLGGGSLFAINSSNCEQLWNLSVQGKKLIVSDKIYTKSEDNLSVIDKNGTFLWSKLLDYSSDIPIFEENSTNIYIVSGSRFYVINSSGNSIYEKTGIKSRPYLYKNFVYMASINSLIILNISNFSQEINISLSATYLPLRDISIFDNNLYLSGSLNAYRNELNFTSIDNTSIDAGSSVSLDIKEFEDYDESSLRYSWVEDGIEIATTQNISSYSKSCGNSGDKNITVYVKDKYFSKSKQINVSINYVACSSSSSSSSGGGGGSNDDTTYISPIVSPISQAESKINEIILSPFSRHITAVGDFTNKKLNEIILDDRSKVALKKISIEVENSQKNVEIVISKVEDLPVEVTQIKSGVYEIIEITSTIPNSEIKRAYITMSIEKSYLEENNAVEDDIKIKRFNNGEWKTLPISSIGYKDNILLFTAETSGFSFFAVVLEKRQTVEESKIAEAEIQEEWFINIYWIIVPIVLVVMLYIIFKPKEKNGKSININ